MDHPATFEIEDFKSRLAEAERRIAELTGERDEANELVQRAAEQVADSDAVIERWIEAFGMTLDNSGQWSFMDGLTERHHELIAKYNALLRDWNKFVGQYNLNVAPKEIGRPLDASPAQCSQVRKLKKAGRSLRVIADETNLSLQTVRTILGREAGTDRTSARRLKRIDPDRAAALSEQARKRSRDALPRQINEALTKGKSLRKEAKGLK
jgi:hypothetical protein